MKCCLFWQEHRTFIWMLINDSQWIPRVSSCYWRLCRLNLCWGKKFRLWAMLDFVFHWVEICLSMNIKRVHFEFVHLSFSFSMIDVMFSQHWNRYLRLVLHWMQVFLGRFPWHLLINKAMKFLFELIANIHLRSLFLATQHWLFHQCLFKMSLVITDSIFITWILLECLRAFRFI